MTDAELSSFGSWQVPYFCLTLAEKAAEVAPKQASSPVCAATSFLFEDAHVRKSDVQLLLHILALIHKHLADIRHLGA